MKAGDLDISVVGIEDLLTMKRAADRDQDRVDIARLERVQRRSTSGAADDFTPLLEEVLKQTGGPITASERRRADKTPGAKAKATKPRTKRRKSAK